MFDIFPWKTTNQWSKWCAINFLLIDKKTDPCSSISKFFFSLIFFCDFQVQKYFHVYISSGNPKRCLLMRIL